MFYVQNDKIEVCPNLVQYNDITNKVEEVLFKLKEKNIFSTLKGWRDEKYEIRPRFGQVPLFAMERAATPMFGLLQYGVDLNGYVQDEDGQISLWISKRSAKKPTWPGKYDNFVAGGLSVGHGIKDTAVKESQEEANLPLDLTDRLKAAGCVRKVF